MAAFEDEGDGDHQGAHDIIDEEELALLQKMKELKKIYKQNYNALKDAKAQVHYIQQSIDTLKQNLVSAFEDWYSQTFLLEDDLQTTSLVSFIFYIFYRIKELLNRLPQLCKLPR